MFLIGNGTTGLIPDIHSALHEFIISQPFAKCTALDFQAMAKTMNDKYRLGMNHVRYLGFDAFGVTIPADIDTVAVGNTQFLGFPRLIQSTFSGICSNSMGLFTVCPWVCSAQRPKVNRN